MAYQLISFVLCPFVQRSVITLKEKHISFEIIYIDLQQPPDWFLAISPMGKVPVLRVDERRVLFESAVINEYLDETNPPLLHPQEPWQRALNRAWIEFGSNLIGSQYRLLVAPNEAELSQARDELLAGLRQLEQQLEAGPFFNGAAFSLVDTAYAPLFMRLDWIERHSPQRFFEGLPKLAQWSAALLARPAVQESVVADFEEQLTHWVGQQNSYLGQGLR